MLLFFKIFVWICFVSIGVYVYLFGKLEEKMDEKVFLIRKIWYLIYMFGGLIYWTNYPNSIFTDWKNYVIVLVVFVIIDAFIFLNMYLSKLGNQEMKRLTKTVSVNESLIQENMSMTKNLLDFLNTEGIVGYYGSKEEYLLGLKHVLQLYAEKEGMFISLIPFLTAEQKEQALLPYVNSKAIRSKLERLETHYNDVEKSALHPVTLINDEMHVLKISASRPVSEMDCLLFVLLIFVYDFAVPEDAQINE